MRLVTPKLRTVGREFRLPIRSDEASDLSSVFSDFARYYLSVYRGLLNSFREFWDADVQEALSAEKSDGDFYSLSTLSGVVNSFLREQRTGYLVKLAREVQDPYVLADYADWLDAACFRFSESMVQYLLNVFDGKEFEFRDYDESDFECLLPHGVYLVECYRGDHVAFHLPFQGGVYAVVSDVDLHHDIAELIKALRFYQSVDFPPVRLHLWRQDGVYHAELVFKLSQSFVRFLRSRRDAIILSSPRRVYRRSARRDIVRRRASHVR